MAEVLLGILFFGSMGAAPWVVAAVVKMVEKAHYVAPIVGGGAV